MKKLIEINKLNKYYGNFQALSDIDMNLYEGDIYGLIGKNGAGKTTLFKQILGLSQFQSGELSILGSQTDVEIHKARKSIGFYINSNFFPYLNAKENLEYYRVLKGIKSKDEVDRVLEIVGLNEVDKKYKSFSMGMKQRLGIANAIMGNPKIVILDEPINGLDPQGIVDIRKLIKTLNEKESITFIVSSHILNELDLIANRFGMIDNGVLLTEITQEDLFKNKQRLIIKSNSYEQTLTFLEKQLKLNILETNHIDEIVTSNVEDSSELLKLLLKAGLEINEIYYQKESLEEFYFDLSGGGIN